MDAKDEIKQRLGVEEVVGDYLELKRSGRNLKALSPFTAEKTASFMVSPEKQIWHDFSSGKGGDIFTFVMEMEGVDFTGALEILARKANVDLTKFRGGGRVNQQHKDRLIEAHDLAVRYFYTTMTKNTVATNYLFKERRFTKQIVEEFKLGYAPNSGDALVSFLKKRGFNPKEIRDSSLGVSYQNNLRDMFRSRIMIPLLDGTGRPIGFTGRILGDGQPKYLNTAQTEIYDKSNHVFGLSNAKEAIRQTGFVVVTEGNLDVVASHMVDAKNVVAVAGTATTRRQLVQLSRLTQDVRLAFDNDRAGIDATMRVIPIAQEVDVSLSIINLDGGKDPDDIIRTSPDKWKKLITQSQYVVDWVLEQLTKQFDITTAQGKKDFSTHVLKLISSLKDPVEIDHYVKVVAKKLGVSSQAIKDKLITSSVKTNLKRKKTDTVDKTVHTSDYQDLLIGLMMRYTELRESLDQINAKHFSKDWCQSAYKLLATLEHKPIVKTPKQLQEYDTYVKIALFKAEELYGNWSSSDLLVEAIGLSRRLLNDYKKRQKQDLSRAIAEAELTGDDAKRRKLLNEFNQLIKGE